jgi:hypothetical protein
VKRSATGERGFQVVNDIEVVEEEEVIPSDVEEMETMRTGSMMSSSHLRSKK